ncbi:aconitate hydratase [Pseudoscourfieldia marina]
MPAASAASASVAASAAASASSSSVRVGVGRSHLSGLISLWVGEGGGARGGGAGARHLFSYSFARSHSCFVGSGSSSLTASAVFMSALASAIPSSHSRSFSSTSSLYPSPAECASASGRVAAAASSSSSSSSSSTLTLTSKILIGALTRQPREPDSASPLPPSSHLERALRIAWPMAILYDDNPARAAGGMGTLVLPTNLKTKTPRVYGVRLVGELERWVDGYDVGMAAVRLLQSVDDVDVVEFHGPGCETLGLGDATALCFVASAKTKDRVAALFPPTERVLRGWANVENDGLLEALTKGRDAADDQAHRAWAPDEGASYEAGSSELDLSALEPSVCLADDPSISWTLTELREGVAETPWGADTALRVSQAPREDDPGDDAAEDNSDTSDAETNPDGSGRPPPSCDFTIGEPSHLGTHTDIRRAAHIAAQVTRRGLTFVNQHGGVMCCAGSAGEAEVSTRRRQFDELEKARAVVKALGDDTIADVGLTTALSASCYAAADGTKLFANPTVVACLALTGDLAFDPRVHRLSDDNGEAFELTPLKHGATDDA